MSKERARPDSRNLVSGGDGAPKSGTSCCGMSAFAEPLFLVRGAKADGPLKRRFGYVPVCSGCKKIVGDYRLDNPMGDKDVIAAQKAFNGTSWAMMLDSHHWPPFNFERGTTGHLIPENYKGQLRNQADLAPAASAPGIEEEPIEEYPGE